MKKILLAILAFFIAAQMNAQDKPDMFDFLINFERKTSIEDFKTKYSEFIHPLNDTLKVPNEAGLFFTELFDYDGNPSMQLVVIDPINGGVTMCVLPDLIKIDSLAYTSASDKLKAYVINKIGEPALTDSSIEENADFLALFAQGGIEKGKRYVWENDKEEAEYAAFSITTNGIEMFIFMIMPTIVEEAKPIGMSSCNIQRKFFKYLELGKYMAGHHLPSYLDVKSYNILETKTSEGKKYQVIYDGYFGGHKWNLIEIDTVQEKLATIHFTNSSTTDNKYLYDTLLEKLTVKYGEPMQTAETSRGWYDSSTMISLYYVYSTTQGGEWRHFVVLGYVDRELYNTGSNIAADEL